MQSDRGVCHGGGAEAGTYIYNLGGGSDVCHGGQSEVCQHTLRIFNVHIRINTYVCTYVHTYPSQPLSY